MCITVHSNRGIVTESISSPAKIYEPFIKISLEKREAHTVEDLVVLQQKHVPHSGHEIVGKPLSERSQEPLCRIHGGREVIPQQLRIQGLAVLGS